MKILTDNGQGMDSAAFGRRDDLMDAFERSGLPARAFAAGLVVGPAVFGRRVAKVQRCTLRRRFRPACWVPGLRWIWPARRAWW